MSLGCATFTALSDVVWASKGVPAHTMGTHHGHTPWASPPSAPNPPPAQAAAAALSNPSVGKTLLANPNGTTRSEMLAALAAHGPANPPLSAVIQVVLKPVGGVVCQV